MNSSIYEMFPVIASLSAGLALFLFGMQSMSQSLQEAAGPKMKTILARVTSNPASSLICGIVATALLQSSSAVTVMVIGFVSANLMTLPAAVAVMFGSNIGTTMTAQILAFKIGDLVGVFLVSGLIGRSIAKRSQTKALWYALFCFGVLFVGIETMGSAMKPLIASPFFVQMMEAVANIPVLGVLTGTLMTLIAQSSSATIALLQSVASTPGVNGLSILGLSGAVPILLGDNIGTTITAVLAASMQNKDAKRVALAHVIFNVSGAIVVLMVLPWFIQLVEWISGGSGNINMISRQIANAHTLFNVLNTIVWFPMIGILVKLINFVIPGRSLESISVLSNRINAEGALTPAIQMRNELLDSARSLFLQLQSGCSLNQPQTAIIKAEETAEQIEQKIASLEGALLAVEDHSLFQPSGKKEAAILLESLHHFKVMVHAAGKAARVLEERPEVHEDHLKNTEAALVRELLHHYDYTVSVMKEQMVEESLQMARAMASQLQESFIGVKRDLMGSVRYSCSIQDKMYSHAFLTSLMDMLQAAAFMAQSTMLLVSVKEEQNQAAGLVFDHA